MENLKQCKSYNEFGHKSMKITACGLMAVALFCSPSAYAQGKSAQLWLTNEDSSALLQKQKAKLPFTSSAGEQPAIEIFDQKKLQPIDGFGFALTGGSAQHLSHMDPAKRKALLRELFGTGARNIGISYLRVSIGASDLNEYVYSYDDLPAGETDPDLTKFSLKDDQKYVIPILKQILAIQPDIKILGSPWSAPAWMKTNENVKGGSLKPEFYESYAKYFVKYVQGMAAEGIRIDAITMQNEPLNEKNTPSMHMSASEQAMFLRDHLGPAFQAAGIKTKILLFDHNCNHPDYPMEILSDPLASQYADGSAFHLYEGEISAMSEVHNAYPSKNLYFTEYMAVEHSDKPNLLIAKHVSGTVVGAIRNWSRNVLLWNLAADSKFEPHTNNGGCPICQGAITIDGNEVTRNLAYYTIAHFSKFVRPNSVHIDSSSPDGLPNVAFQTPRNKIVLVVANTGSSAQTFRVAYRGKYITTTLQAGSVGTLVW
jgi:glucosylceramidase